MRVFKTKEMDRHMIEMDEAKVRMELVDTKRKEEQRLRREKMNSQIEQKRMFLENNDSPRSMRGVRSSIAKVIKPSQITFKTVEESMESNTHRNSVSACQPSPENRSRDLPLFKKLENRFEE